MQSSLPVPALQEGCRWQIGAGRNCHKLRSIAWAAAQCDCVQTNSVPNGIWNALVSAVLAASTCL